MAGRKKEVGEKLIKVDVSIIERMHARGEITLTDEQLNQLDGRPYIDMPVGYDGRPPASNRPVVVEWIDPLTAVHMLAPNFGGDAKAKLAIIERLKDHAIQCTMTWLCIQPDIGPLPRRRPQQSDAPQGPHEAREVSKVERNPTGTRLGGALWHNIEDVERDSARWSWNEGLFVASYPISRSVDTGERAAGVVQITERRERMVASGVRFNKHDIERMLPTKGSNDVAAADEKAVLDDSEKRQLKSQPGPKRKTDWEDWIAEVVVHVWMNGIDLGQSQEEFHFEIADLLKEKRIDAPDFSRVARAISAIKRRWQLAKQSGELDGKRLS
jgi:hypothetical protein